VLFSAVGLGLNQRTRTWIVKYTKILTAIVAFLAFALIARSYVRVRRIDGISRESYAYSSEDKVWRGSEVGKMLARACSDCHSNRTTWPWYSHVPPVSWWIRGHVREGREQLNFSEWASDSEQRRHDALESICGAISMGGMPPASYLLMHRDARLTPQDKQILCVLSGREADLQNRSSLTK
jgi:hypothetical protein